jgi:hypothetical protein
MSKVLYVDVSYASLCALFRMMEYPILPEAGFGW